ncbi:phospholipase D-like domain-containing protein [Halococcoides cellulosivorans]|uniref:phospholipase D-like domain-containing protein n=1 Tax=Halococcoides cellulosivorans TaxID=1679096 RepID=UPI00131F1F92|nr:phospholipase D-like domain-containing protein [Halococcoides cellulosivorans]
MDSRIARGAWTLLVLAVLLCALSASGAAAADSGSIVAIYPDPIADEDAGEFVVLELSAEANYTLSDGEQTITIPPNATGRVAVTAAPERVRPFVDVPIVAVDTFPALANSGDEVVLRAGNRTVDRVVYADPEEGAIGRPVDDGITWRHVDATDRDPVVGSGGPAETFLLPDAGGRVCEALSTADRRIELAGYTLTSRCVTDALVTAADRGVRVTVLVEGDPAGGFPPAMAERLDRLAATDATVRVVTGSGAPYRYHHAKYAVVDDRAVVTTENFKPAGTGGHSSRGWGTIVTSDAVVATLSRTIDADAGARGVSNWSAARERIDVANGSAPAATAYPERIPPRTVDTERTTLLLAPDNAERALAARIRTADRRVLIEQAGIGGVDVPLVQAAIDAAENGTRVRVLLSAAWYAREENRAVVSRLDTIADRRDLPLEAKLSRPHGRFEKIHAKGVVVDDRAYVGSLNWNFNSIRNNREVVVGLQGEGPAAYFARAFRADWVGGRWRLPVGLAAVATVCWVALGWVGRRIEFEQG